MDYVINITRAESMPLHTHDQYEIICYTGGSGVMRTREGQYAVAENTIVIVPPGVGHGSFSDGEIERIYIRGEFRQSFSLPSRCCCRITSAARAGAWHGCCTKTASATANTSTLCAPPLCGFC